MRHTPAFGHPSPRGDGLPHHFECQYLAIVALPRHPLSERGGRRPGCVAPSIPKYLTVNSKVSHHQVKSIAPSIPKCRTINPKVSHPQFQSVASLTSKMHPAVSPIKRCFLVGTNTGCCPLVVRLMSACCPLLKRTTSGHQADNKRTTNGDDMEKLWHYVLVVSELWRCMSCAIFLGVLSRIYPKSWGVGELFFAVLFFLLIFADCHNDAYAAQRYDC